MAKIHYHEIFIQQNNRKQEALFLVGPCVMESEGLVDEIADLVSEGRKKYGVEIIFKASFDKANRTSIKSFRGPGMMQGLKWLADVKSKYNLPVTTDIHESHQAEPVGHVVDILQIPAFLCRQTDLLVEAAKTQKIVNIKKAQFLSGADMKHPLEKVRESGNSQILLTERGTMFGYNNLVVDFRNLPVMKSLGVPVVMDCTHSVQRPGGAGDKSGGNSEFVPSMALAAKAFGASGYFFEIHPKPDTALSDGPNMITPDAFFKLLPQLI